MSMDADRKLATSMQVDEDEVAMTKKTDILVEKDMVYMKKGVLYTLITFDEPMTLFAAGCGVIGFYVAAAPC